MSTIHNHFTMCGYFTNEHYSQYFTYQHYHFHCYDEHDRRSVLVH